MTINDVLAGGLERNLAAVKMLLADFSDADMLVRPARGANHAAWQIGHLANAETSMVKAARPDAAAPLPAGWSDRFGKAMAASDEAANFLTKAEVLAQFEKTRAATIAWARSLSPQELAQPAPERIRHLAPTLADLAAFIPVHTTLHLGQVSVIRRVLGKPVLF